MTIARNAPEASGPVLVLDTAGRRCAAGVVSGGVMVAESSEELERGHAERIFPMIDAALADAATDRSRLRSIVVCTGPGGFTGPRAGVAAARGLSLALGVPAQGVTRFEALALRNGGRVLIALPAPRGRFVVQRWREGRPVGGLSLLDPEDPALTPEPGEVRLGAEEAETLDLAALAAAAAARPASDAPRPFYAGEADARPAAPPPLLFD